ncbi:Apolipoprotein n-acyltransferase [Mycena kentingensis (nom. inval.)]|nr:Apolipoprotein n-acyltransferase [Mycena kentingensis (nom. inval.)]
MAYYSGEAEPFEEEAQRGDLERKLSKRKSNAGTSLFSRKSSKRASAMPQSPKSAPPVPGPLKRPAASLGSASATSLARPPPSISEHGSEWSDSAMSLPLSRSIIPETLKELPAWYRDSQHFTTRYTMHNPVGPKWYKNHHLVAPTNTRSPTGPPSVFSTSFPAMAASGDDSRMPGMSRSPSKSPGQTPNSSQTRMEDVSNVPRTRKTSQTAHDNVDLMDVSDPWGTAWHHESPYDVGKSNSPVSFDENQATRSRTSSMTAPQNRRKTVTPSPLSQSTSAVHLQPPEPPRTVTRKLSKRRTVGIFGRHAPSLTEGLNSRAATPSLGPPLSFAPAEKSKKDQRGSVLGRIAKRFSISRKPAMEVVRQPSPTKRQPSPEKFQAPEPINDTPTPPLAPPAPEPSLLVNPPPPEPEVPQPQIEDDRRSSVSLDATYRMGRLMVANPDPGSADSTPVQLEMRLPSDNMSIDTHSREGTAETVKPTDLYIPLSPEAMTLSTLSPGYFSAPVPQSPVPTPAIAASRHLFALRAESPPPPTPLPKSPLPTPAIDIPVTRPPSPPRPSASPTKVSASPTKPMSSPTKDRSPSPPRPPPSPEKLPQPFANDHRLERPVSTVRPTVESSLIHESSSARRVPAPTIPKTQPPRPPSPKLPAVPFPLDYGPGSSKRPESMVLASPNPADISPLSAASVLVNPPTPYNPDAQIPDDTDSIPPPVPSKRNSRDPSPSSQVAVTGRETETFRLVRSSSGTVYASTETIRAAGEQWEVMESSKGASKGKKSGDREQRRLAKAEKEAAEAERKGRSERKRQSSAEGTNSLAFPTGSDQPRISIPQPLAAQPRKEGSPTKRKEESPTKRKSAQIRLDKPQPPPPAPSRTLERGPSNAARPISEVPLAAEMNQVRAREAWDMDRLWKARSMSGMEPNGAIPPPLPTKEKAVEVQQLGGVHGSSHTAFLMSAPFQPQPPPIYHSMPPAPYPAGYANGSNSRVTSSSPPTLPPLSNPLPEPPRESPYQPAPLTLPDYWGKHASPATTAH